MTADISTLGIVVKSDGIKEATSSLNDLNTAADNAEKTVKRLTDAVSSMKGVNSGASTSLVTLGGSLALVAQAAQQVYNTLNLMAVQMNVAIVVTNNYAAAIRNTSGAMTEHTQSSGVFLNTLKAMTAAALAYTGVNFAKSIIDAADKFSDLNAKLLNVTGSQNNATVAMGQMYEVSQNLRTPLQEVVKLYAVLYPAMANLGYNSDTVKTSVQGLSTALKLSGATAGAASSVMLAYAHSASTGLVQGRVFNSLITQAPIVMRALEDETGKTGAELKKMGTTGALSFAMLNQAVVDYTPKWTAMLGNVPITFEGAITRIQNAWLMAIGQMGQDTKFNQQLAAALKIIEDMIPAVAQGLGEAFIGIIKWVNENKESLSQIWMQVKGIVVDVLHIGESFASVGGEIGSAGDQLSLIGFTIFTVRLALATIEDIFTSITGIVAILGGDLYLYLVNPLVQVSKDVLVEILDSFSKLSTVLAGMASSVGLDKISSKLKASAIDAKDFSNAIETSSVTLNSEAIGTSLVDAGNAYLDSLKNGGGALDKLLNSEVAITSEKKKQLTFQENFNQNPAPIVNEAALKAAANELKKFTEQMASLTAEYDKQLTIQTRMADLGLAADKLGPDQKLVIELTEHLNALETTHTSIIQGQLIIDTKKRLAQAEINANLEIANDERRKALELDKTLLKQENSIVKTLQAQATAAEERVAGHGQAKGTSAQGMLDQAINKRDAAVADQAAVMPDDLAAVADVNAMVAALNKEVDARQRIAAAEKILGQYNIDAEWAKLFDPSKAQKFTDAMVAGFGKVGKAIGGVVNSVRTYEEGIGKVAKAQKLADETTGNSSLKAQREAQVQLLNQQVQITAFVDLASAASGFFGVHTKGYQAMQVVEKGFRLWEMAIQLESFLQQMGFLGTTTAATVAADATKTASGVSSAAAIASASLVAGTASAAAGVANQASGDPYSAFERMAAMAVIMAGLGFVVGGIGGGSSHIAADRQASAGTGTVLNDATKQSDSISASINLLSKNSNIGLKYSSEMTASLKNIESSLAATANAILTASGTSLVGAGFSGSKVQNPIEAGVSGLKSLLSGNVSPLAGFLQGAGFGKSSSLVDSGITAGNQTVGSVLSNGFQGQAYQDEEVKKKAFFVTYSDSNDRNTSALDPTVEASFTSVIKGMVSTVTEAGSALGLNAATVSKSLASVELNLGDISLKGLSANQIQTQLNAIFSAFGDSLVSAALGPTLAKFQQSGEGLLQTATRVASSVEDANQELSKLGLTAINFSNVVNTSGDVGAEIVRQTIELKETGTSLGDIIQAMSGTASDIGDTYTSLLAARRALQDLGVAKDVTTDLINAAGGLNALQSSLATYQKDFFTQAQQNTIGINDLTQQFAVLGLALPSTRDGFVALVNSLASSGTSGQALATQVIALGGAFDTLASQYDTNVATARSNLTNAYNNESTALTTLQTNFTNFAASLDTFKSSLTTGNLSTLSAVDKYNQEKAQYASIEALAMQGDQTAIGQYQTVANAFLSASRSVNSSGDAYTADYQQVLSQTQALETNSTLQASVADKSLAALQTQVSSLITVNTSVLSVAEAIAQLQSVIEGGIAGTATANGAGSKSTILPVLNGTHANGLSYVPFDGYIAELHKGESVLTAAQTRTRHVGTDNSNSEMIDEIRSLREEVAGLRQDQQSQTGSVIAANYDANDRAAKVVVRGQTDAAKTSSYADKVRKGVIN